MLPWLLLKCKLWLALKAAGGNTAAGACWLYLYHKILTSKRERFGYCRHFTSENNSGEETQPSYVRIRYANKRIPWLTVMLAANVYLSVTVTSRVTDGRDDNVNQHGWDRFLTSTKDVI